MQSLSFRDEKNIVLNWRILMDLSRGRESKSFELWVMKKESQSWSREWEIGVAGANAPPPPPPLLARTPRNITAATMGVGLISNHLIRSITSHRNISSDSNLNLIRSISSNSNLDWMSAGNQRHKSSLVGTAETRRSTAHPKSFCEWVAGIIDGDGSIEVSKKGYTCVEITMGFEDLPLLRYIQHMLGGGIKMRAGAKAYRYRLHNQPGMIKLMNGINGHIRHSRRLLQLHRACQVLEIPSILPLPLDAKSNWFAGFFDAEGTISIAVKHGLPQLSIGVRNKLLQDVECYEVVFGGSLCFDSGQNGYYQWSIRSREDVITMLDYFKSNTFRSHKSRRFFLIQEYYRLYDFKAFKPDSVHHKAWLSFLDKWNKLMI